MSQQKILVVALMQRGAASPATYELLTAGRSLANALKQPLVAFQVGGTAESARELVERGADRVLWSGGAALQDFNDELHAQAVLAAAAQEKPSWLLLPASVAGRSLACRVAVKLGAGLATDVNEIDPASGTVKRSHYSGNLQATMEFKSEVRVVTVQGMVFPQAPRQAGRSGEVAELAFAPAAAGMEFLSFQAEEAGEIDLGGAERIVSGGRGVGGPDGFKLIRDLAHALGAAVAASRAAVDSGWIPYRHQVGLTGRTVRPKLYVACGISGQIQHLAGMSTAGSIVAINMDPECPMMQQATISVVGDMFELIPLVIAEIKKRRGAPVAA
ncbi:MAG: electron transfer flavoprotein subunit alpha/FixB family protein [Elusimicrobia bacterium]|nr:electron transfer flavoprotein subunit alpha/FixB family protein [Elusimicrobiota bacterium]